MTAFAAHGHLEYYAVLFIFLRFSLLADPNPLSAALLAHRIINPHKLQQFSSGR